MMPHRHAGKRWHRPERRRYGDPTQGRELEERMRLSIAQQEQERCERCGAPMSEHTPHAPGPDAPAGTLFEWECPGDNRKRKGDFEWKSRR